MISLQADASVNKNNCHGYAIKDCKILPFVHRFQYTSASCSCTDIAPDRAHSRICHTQ